MLARLDSYSMSGLITESTAAAAYGEEHEHLGVYAKSRIDFNRAVADWCLRRAARCIEREALEEALRWDAVAARVMSFECAALASAELEKQLILIGRGLPDTGACPRKGSKRWLHVVTEVYPDGGHSAMLRRWIRQDPQHNSHSMVLLAQNVPVPEPLEEALKARNGSLFRMDPLDPLLARAGRLRSIVRAEADVVVLHTHPWDVIATVALANPGGPPVLLVNHAAHIFWAGASIADVILNCRHSPQEDEWTAECRGNNRIMHLPIPLDDPGYLPGNREAARSLLKLPADARVMLTVGIDHKYTPLPGIDFLSAMGAVLTAQPEAYLVAVGPKFDERWRELKEAAGDRLVLVEKQPAASMATYFAAADLYLEGFPFGSTTSLLEAGLRGIASVLPPKMCPPPFTTDGIALQTLTQSGDISEYVARILALLDDRKERLRIGRLLADSVRTHHCGEGWARYLEEVQSTMPAVHDVIPLKSPLQVPENLSAYWTAFSYAVHDDPLGMAWLSALYQGLKPAVDTELLRQLHRSGRRGRGRHAPSLFILLYRSSRQFLFAVLKPVSRLVKPALQRLNIMTERVRIICQTGK